MGSKTIRKSNLVNISTLFTESRNFVAMVRQESGVDEKDCYQCGKCSAGCPLAFNMDYMPREIMRMLQLGLVEDILHSHTIWLCSHCITCYSRCPRSVDLPRIMDTLRLESIRRGYTPEKQIKLFGDLFLWSVRQFGRVFEMGLIIGFNIKSGQFFKDIMLGPAMLIKRKISLLPHKISDGGAVKEIFDRTREIEREGGHS
jgi:heterodisulfide reductase subunit C2